MKIDDLHQEILLASLSSKDWSTLPSINSVAARISGQLLDSFASRKLQFEWAIETALSLASIGIVIRL